MYVPMFLLPNVCFFTIETNKLNCKTGYPIVIYKFRNPFLECYSE